MSWVHQKVPVLLMQYSTTYFEFGTIRVNLEFNAFHHFASHTKTSGVTLSLLT